MSDDEMICEINLQQPAEDDIIEVLANYKNIAVVGLSPKEDRASNRVAKYMMGQGYDIVPVNPMHDNILGRRSYSSLLEIPDDVEIVDIFRKPGAVMEIVEQAIAKGAKVVWMQEGIVKNDAAQKAQEAGLKVIMDRCILKEHIKWKS